MVEITDIAANGLVNATPILLAALGEMMVERTGRVNLGVEGLMAVGAATSVYAGIQSGSPLIGVLAASIAGILLSLVYVFMVLLVGADQIVVGLTLVFMGLGVAELIGSMTGGAPGPRMPILTPFIDPLMILAVLTAIAYWIILSRTWLGVEIRGLGESDELAKTRGLRILRIRASSIILGGLLAGIAGAYMTLNLHYGRWYSGITAGWGWIAIGVVILGYWHPLGVMLASYMIGILFASRTLLSSIGLHPAIADATPYILVIITLGIVVKLSEKLGISPPSMVWKRE
ncbi:MAG: ABC transporter permease [Desulfurococcales archaeon]|nr:ABC transporter permease [Desulfurococcales archaeon]